MAGESVELGSGQREGRHPRGRQPGADQLADFLTLAFGVDDGGAVSAAAPIFAVATCAALVESAWGLRGGGARE
jgi:hypothetical protein